jgi:hypothetical protein
MSIVKKAIESQIAFLRNVGASFKIVLSSGEVIVHDPNNVIIPKDVVVNRKPKRNPDARHGEPTDYVLPFLQNMEPGQAVTIPCKYHYDTMRSVVCNNARRLWGSGNYLTEFDEKRENLTILRVN